MIFLSIIEGFTNSAAFAGAAGAFAPPGAGPEKTAGASGLAGPTPGLGVP